VSDSQAVETAAVRAEWIAIECMRHAQVIRRGTHTAQTPESTAQEIFDWAYTKKDVSLAMTAMRNSVDNRTGGASLAGVLQKADDAYSFASAMRQRIEGQPSKKVRRKKASSKRVAATPK